jgi:hypothetical protein
MLKTRTTAKLYILDVIWGCHENLGVNSLTGSVMVDTWIKNAHVGEIATQAASIQK